MPIYTDDEKIGALADALIQVGNIDSAENGSLLAFYQGRALGYASALNKQSAITLAELNEVVASITSKADARKSVLRAAGLLTTLSTEKSSE